MGAISTSRGIQVTWLTRSDDIIVGPEPVTVFQVKARRDCEINSVEAFFRSAPRDLVAHIVTTRQEAAVGVRILPVEGRQMVSARQGLPAPAHSLRGAVIYHRVGPYTVWESDHAWWRWAGQMDELRLVAGQAIGVVVKANVRCQCQVTVAGN